MAGQGRAPKSADQRRNRNQLRRGDWVTLVPQTDVKVPELPEPPGGAEKWSERTTKAWGNWWRDAASQMWTGADIDLLEHLAYVHEQWVLKGSASLLTEIRYVRES